jgi:hypothetical protein
VTAETCVAARATVVATGAASWVATRGTVVATVPTTWVSTRDTVVAAGVFATTVCTAEGTA